MIPFFIQLGPPRKKVLRTLQQSFHWVQHAFSDRHLVLHTSTTKLMWFGMKKTVSHPGVITTVEGVELEQVNTYKYLGVWLDSTLSCSHHITKLQAKVKARLGFLYPNRSSFTQSAKLTLTQVTKKASCHAVRMAERLFCWDVVN